VQSRSKQISATVNRHKGHGFRVSKIILREQFSKPVTADDLKPSPLGKSEKDVADRDRRFE
jgi:hypothetical protein